jgi:hypothetical protein
VSPEATSAGTVAGLVLAAAALFAACAAAGPSGGGETSAEQPFETVVAQSHSGLEEPRREVIRDEASWARLWGEIQAGVTPRPPLPAVDFERHMLIAVALGTRRSGGFGIKVQGVASRGDTLEVSVLETCPAPGAMVIMALTQPLEVVRVPRLPQEPTFRETRAAACK